MGIYYDCILGIIDEFKKNKNKYPAYFISSVLEIIDNSLQEHKKEIDRLSIISGAEMNGVKYLYVPNINIFYKRMMFDIQIDALNLRNYNASNKCDVPYYLGEDSVVDYLILEGIKNNINSLILKDDEFILMNKKGAIYKYNNEVKDMKIVNFRYCEDFKKWLQDKEYSSSETPYLCGILLKDGTFYPCKYKEHSLVIEEINKKKYPEAYIFKDAITFGCGDSYDEKYCYCHPEGNIRDAQIRFLIENKEKLSKKQKNMLNLINV